MLNAADVQSVGVDRFPLRAVTPPAQIDALARDILALKKKLNAVILAHTQTHARTHTCTHAHTRTHTRMRAHTPPTRPAPPSPFPPLSA